MGEAYDQWEPLVVLLKGTKEIAEELSIANKEPLALYLVEASELDNLVHELTPFKDFCAKELLADQGHEYWLLSRLSDTYGQTTDCNNLAVDQSDAKQVLSNIMSMLRAKDLQGSDVASVVSYLQLINVLPLGDLLILLE